MIESSLFRLFKKIFDIFIRKRFFLAQNVSGKDEKNVYIYLGGENTIF